MLEAEETPPQSSPELSQALPSRESPVFPPGAELAQTTAEVEPAAIEERRQEADQRWWLRYSVAAVVAGMLWCELLALFLLVLLQGIKIHIHLACLQWFEIRFHLNEWLFGLLIGGVLVQTVWCLQAIATHLFPGGSEKMKVVPSWR